MRNSRPRGPPEDDSNYVVSQAQEELPELPCRQLGLQQRQLTIRKVVILSVLTWIPQKSSAPGW